MDKFILHFRLVKLFLSGMIVVLLVWLIREILDRLILCVH